MSILLCCVPALISHQPAQSSAPAAPLVEQAPVAASRISIASRQSEDPDTKLAKALAAVMEGGDNPYQPAARASSSG